MPSHRGTWDAHGKDGWYIGPAMHHYQCYRVLVKSTQGIRIPPKVKFFPDKCTMRTNSSADQLLSAAKNLIHALTHPSPPVPFEHVGDQDVIDLKKLSNIFLNKVTPLSTHPNIDPLPRVQKAQAKSIQSNTGYPLPRVPIPSTTHINIKR